MRPPHIISGAPGEIQTRAAHDARADGGRRMILLASRCITIKRRLRGVKMHLQVPIESYNGVVLTQEERPSGTFFSIRLAHPDPELSVMLRAARGQRASIDAWRQWAAYFAVPALIERGGRLWKVIDTVTGTRSGPDAIPPAPCFSAGALPVRRRPVLYRKRARRLGRHSKIFHGERVITSYE